MSNRTTADMPGCKQGVIVDIHCHMLSDRAEAMVQPYFSIEKEPTMRFATDLTREINLRQREAMHEKLTSPKARLADMDSMGIDVQVISPAPTQYFYWLEPEQGREVTRMINDDLSEFASTSDRFLALGTVPLQHTGLAIEELDRCVMDQGMRGIEISSNVNGEELAQRRLEPFFARAEELGALIFIHPLGFTEGRRLASHYFNNVMGNAIESSLAIGHLIFEGVLDRHPGLKVCVAHGGGFLPMYTGRMDHAYSVRRDCCQYIDRLPSSYLKNIHFDSVVFDPEQLNYLVQKYGPNNILLGSDYPYDMAEPDPVRLLKGIKNCSEEDLNKMLGGNALRLLGVPEAEVHKRNINSTN